MNTSIQLGVCYLSAEDEPTYLWAMGVLKQLLEKHNIPRPSVFFTDAETALINALEITWPRTPTVLCIWHVNKAVTTYAKTEGGPHMKDVQVAKGKKGQPSKAFNEFKDAFLKAIWSTTEEEFEEALQCLRKLNGHVTDYLERQYFSPYKQKLVLCYLNDIRHFGTMATSAVESSHRQMKSWLVSSKHDLFTVWELLHSLWQHQHSVYDDKVAYQLSTTQPRFSRQFWSAVLRPISTYALSKAHEQWAKRKTGSNVCSRTFERTHGIPCKHTIKQLLADKKLLRLDHFHGHWWVIRRDAPIVEPSARPILEPRTTRQIREANKLAKEAAAASHRKGAGVTGICALL